MTLHVSDIIQSPSNVEQLEAYGKKLADIRVGSEYNNYGWTPRKPKIGQRGVQLGIERVNRGAKALDRTIANWQEKILPHTLKMDNGSYCMLGQAHPDEYGPQSLAFVSGLDLSKVREEDEAKYSRLYDKWQGDTGSEFAKRHGFLSSALVPFQLLDILWVNLLNERAFYGKKVFLKDPWSGRVLR